MTIKRQTLTQTLLLMGTLTYLAGCDGGASASSSAQAISSSQASSSSQSANSMPIDAAPVGMRRLSKLEYNNTVRDLLGTALEPANDFPFDDFNQFDDATNFPNISMPHLMWYNVSAARLTEETIKSALAGNRDVVNCDIEAASCPQIVIREFGLRAWRRPITEAETERLTAFYDEALALSNDHAAAMQALLHRLILSPNFIFRPEFDEDINSNVAQELNSYELASRLSYFLWGSMPDDELFAKAEDDSLKDSQVLRSQVARMLDSPHAEVLADVFAAQWLGFGNYQPRYNRPTHRDSVRAESTAFVNFVIQNNLPVSELITADYTFLNGYLANQYGMHGYEAASVDHFFVHIWGDDSGRKNIGILGHLSFLESFPTLRSRGLWAMQHLQCENPDLFFPSAVDTHPLISTQPPFDLKNKPKELAEWYQDESLECRDCHSKFEPIGYAFGNFTEAGIWRENYGDGTAIDTTGTLPEGDFEGPAELASVLAKSPALALCAIQYGMRYALGRELDTFDYSRADLLNARDASAIYSIYENTKEAGHRLQDIFTEIVLSPAFRYRRGADSTPKAQQ